MDLKEKPIIVKELKPGMLVSTTCNVVQRLYLPQYNNNIPKTKKEYDTFIEQRDITLEIPIEGKQWLLYLGSCHNDWFHFFLFGEKVVYTNNFYIEKDLLFATKVENV